MTKTPDQLMCHIRNMIDGVGLFGLGSMVRKKSGSNWHGRVVGFYTTDLNENGYCVESSFEKGSVQLYPESALESWFPDLESLGDIEPQPVPGVYSPDQLKR
jgi:hypothetical protein